MTLFRSVPAGTARRSTRSRAAKAGLALLVVLGLGACAPDNTPTAYGAEVEKSFVDFCTGGVIPVESTTTTIASSTFCQCAYTVFKDNVPYNDDDKKTRFSGKYPDDKPTFITLNNELKDDAGKIDQLPDDVKGKLNACPKTQENVTAGSIPNGTTPPGTVPAATGSTVASTTSGSTPA